MQQLRLNVWAIAAVATLAAWPASASAQTVEYYHLDALGSVRAVSDTSGNLVERHDYLPFGEEVAPPSVSQARKFTGKERDAETGLDYFGARYYSANTARFTTIDPVYTWKENLVDPQRWNRYAYVRNNPLRFTDPDGRALDTILDVAAIAYDLFDIGRSVVRGEGVSGTQIGALAADVGSALVPGLTGGGLMVPGGLKAVATGNDVANVSTTVRGARFVADSKGNVADTVATPPGRYMQPDKSATDVLQNRPHGTRSFHGPDPHSPGPSQ